MDREQPPVGALEADLTGTLSRMPGLMSLWGQSIPSTLYRNKKNEWGEWRVKEIHGLTFKQKQAVTVLMNSSDGDAIEGIAAPGRFAVAVAICDGLAALKATETPASRIPDFDFDLVFDFVEAVMPE